MVKKLLLALGLLAAVPVTAQTYHYPALETNNTFTGTDTFNNTVTLGGNVVFSGLTASQCLQLDGSKKVITASCVHTPGYSGLAASDGAGNWISPTGAMVNTLLGYTALNPANNLSDVANASTALFNLGGQPLTLSSTVDPPVFTCSSGTNNKTFSVTKDLKIYQCSNNNVGGTYTWNLVGSAGVTPSGPAYSVQFANSGVTGLQSDSAITVDPVNHKFQVGGSIVGNTFSMSPLSSIPASWTFNVTSPATALASLGNVPSSQILGPTGTTNCLRWDGSGRITTLACSGAGTVTSVGVSVPTQMTVSGSPVTSVGTIALGLNLTGTEAKLVTATTAGASGNYAKWNGAGGLGDSGVPVGSGPGTDYYWSAVAACSTGGTQPVYCGTQSTTLPGNMPDASYQLFCNSDIYTFSGSAPATVCVWQNSYPLPTTAGSTLSYGVVSVMSLGGGGGTYNVYFHAHHN